MSSYQADWFVDDEGEWEDDGIENNNDNDADDKSAMSGDDKNNDHINDEDDDNMTMGDNMTIGYESVMGGMDNKAIAADKQRLRAMAEDDEVFPDEMDTPVDVSARKRFARYRALQSFRSSPWHPKENLPRDYSRIFQFANFSGVQRRSVGQARAVEDMQMRELAKETKFSKEKNKTKGKDVASMMSVEEGCQTAEGSQYFVTDTDMTFVKSGQYVYITLTDVPTGAAQKLAVDGYLLLFSLLTHENKLSILHFTVQRHAGYQDLVKAKDKMLIYAGFRCFWAKPLYSEPNLNCDKHKLERFLRHDRFSVATVFGPSTFMPCPMLMFKDVGDDNLVLVASGSMSSVDPDRIILKKVVLTGIPIRVRKRFAVVKHLFHDPQDVSWFKPAELVTKRGLRGHIKAAVGTHGLLKALFSGPVTQNDTVMLILYKRVFPKLPDDNETLLIT
jgi:pre-rRNA-processing protein TSR1